MNEIAEQKLQEQALAIATAKQLATVKRQDLDKQKLLEAVKAEEKKLQDQAENKKRAEEEKKLHEAEAKLHQAEDVEKMRLASLKKKDAIETQKLQLAKKLEAADEKERQD